MQELTRHRIILLGFMLLFGNQLVLMYTFMMAFMHDGVTMVHVNLFGEQYLDAVVLIISLVVSCCALVLLYQQHEKVLRQSLQK